MAFFDSSISKFLITDVNGVERDVSPYITAIDGLPGPRELNDATTLNQLGAKYHPTIERVTITLELLYSSDVGVGSDTVLAPLSRWTAPTFFQYLPEGIVTGKRKYSGNCWVKNYTTQAKVGATQAGKCELPVDGVVTIGTYTP